jgi:hypothetical protein
MEAGIILLYVYRMVAWTEINGFHEMNKASDERYQYHDRRLYLDAGLKNKQRKDKK